MQVLAVWSSLQVKGSMALLYMDRGSAPNLTPCEVTMTSRVGSRMRLHMRERLSRVAERGSCEFYCHVLNPPYVFSDKMWNVTNIYINPWEKKKCFVKFAAMHYCKHTLLQPVLGGSSYNFICTVLNEYKSCK
jgi:hypothetical protein